MAKVEKKKVIRQTQGSGFFSSLSPMKKDLLIIGLLYVITVVMFSGVVFKNDIFSDSADTASSQAVTHAGVNLEQKEHIEPQWFPYIFSGMPSFGSLMYLSKNISILTAVFKVAAAILFLNSDMGWMIFYFFFGAVGVFLFVRYLGLTHFAALIAALTFLMCPLVLGMAPDGHGSKLMALSYIPYLFLATTYLFDKRTILSVGILALLIGSFLLTMHVQMVYYGFLAVGTYAVAYLISEVTSNPKLAITKGGLFMLALFIGFAIGAFIYLSTYEYSQFSIRGGGEVGVSGGLDKDYATSWSFHPLETITYFIPSFFGFQSPVYWGWLPFTESSVYLGIIPLILAGVALIFQRNKTTIYFGIFTLFILLVSYGKYFPLYDILFNYLPFFNKFRVPVMILMLAPISVGILAAYGIDFLLHQILLNSKDAHLQKFKKGLLVTLGIAAIILVIALAIKPTWFPDTAFSREGDRQQYSPEQISQLRDLRFEGLKGDFLKFGVVLLAGLSLTYFFVQKRMSTFLFAAALTLLFVIDLGMIDKNFLRTMPHQTVEQTFTPSPSISFLKKDTSVYRVFPIRQFQDHDNSWMYFGIQTIGGYSPAKLKIYQEMVDSSLYHGADENFPINMNIVNMLNVKYLVFGGRLPEDKFRLVNVDKQKPELVYENPNALQRAFFVDTAIVVEKNQIYGYLNSQEFNPAKTALIQKQLSATIQKPVNSEVKLINYKAHGMEFATKNDATSLLVISEIYYPVGWKAMIDGTPVEIYRTNSILRSIVVPAGSHKIEVVYDSTMYSSSLTISYVGWGISLLMLCFGLFTFIKEKKTPQD